MGARRRASSVASSCPPGAGCEGARRHHGLHKDGVRRLGRLRRLVMIACCSIGAGAVGIASFASPARASVCSATETGHCYALIENYSTFEGTWVDLLTSADDVYGWEKTDRMQNETWASFPDEGWVEVGNTTGYIAKGVHTSTPVYFYAREEPVGAANFYEYNFTNGPTIGSWFYVQEQDEGNGTWCAWINGGEVYCVAGLPLFSNRQESGLETAANIQPYNYGTTYTWGMELGTGDWSTWNAPRYSNGNTLHEYDGYCIFPVQGSSSWEKGAAFGTPNGNPSCLPNQEGALKGVVSGEAPPTPPGVPAGPGTVAQPAPAESGYTAPSGALLTDRGLEELADSTAQEDGGHALTGTVQTVQASLKSAITKIDPSSTSVAAASVGYTNWLDSTVDLMVLHGNFTLADAPRPVEAAPPAGKVLDLIVDAHTGAVIGIHTSNAAPSDLSSLGAVTSFG